jgi:hypothetical protein
MSEQPETNIESIVETEDHFFYCANEPDGEITYHLQFNNVTLHFFTEEWQTALDFLEKVVEASKQLK